MSATGDLILARGTFRWSIRAPVNTKTTVLVFIIMADIQDSVWDEVDSNNSSSGTQPGFPENQNPSTLNNASRAVMGAIKRDWNRNHPTVTSAGAANAQTLTYSVAPPSYELG